MCLCLCAPLPLFLSTSLRDERVLQLQDESDQALVAYRTAAKLFPGCHLCTLFVGIECARTNNVQLAERVRATVSPHPGPCVLLLLRWSLLMVSHTRARSTSSKQSPSARMTRSYTTRLASSTSKTRSELRQCMLRVRVLSLRVYRSICWFLFNLPGCLLSIPNLVGIEA